MWRNSGVVVEQYPPAPSASEQRHTLTPSSRGCSTTSASTLSTQRRVIALAPSAATRLTGGGPCLSHLEIAER